MMGLFNKMKIKNETSKTYWGNRVANSHEKINVSQTRKKYSHKMCITQ
jgi:hypothetical protein